jgi:hypothetical protein
MIPKMLTKTIPQINSIYSCRTNLAAHSYIFRTLVEFLNLGNQQPAPHKQSAFKSVRLFLTGEWGMIWGRVGAVTSAQAWVIVWDFLVECICLVGCVILTIKHNFKPTLIYTFKLFEIYKLNLKKKNSVGITNCVVIFIGYNIFYSFVLLCIVINYTTEEINAYLNALFFLSNLQSTVPTASWKSKISRFWFKFKQFYFCDNCFFNVNYSKTINFLSECQMKRGYWRALFSESNNSCVTTFCVSSTMMLSLTIYLTLMCQNVESNPGPPKAVTSTLSILTYNCNGLGDPKKLKRLLLKLNVLVNKGCIVFLQETHIVDTKYLEMIWKHSFLSNCIKTNSAGVIILYNKQYDLVHEYSDG